MTGMTGELPASRQRSSQVGGVREVYLELLSEVYFELLSGVAGSQQLWHTELALAPATRGDQGAKALGPFCNNTRRDPLRRLRGRRITPTSVAILAQVRNRLAQGSARVVQPYR